ncbi:hypothetical protein WJX72_008207 [[Myrmecia] bisecta]|uniref:non-specific serine/threonine protein kinase n=1 Tax=[Myrmecia] bisecta TaxID=41462 RepID=A0AAW1PYB9_9CHLO
MRAHFAEVDEFELAEESPLPPGARRQDDCPFEQQLGLEEAPAPEEATLTPLQQLLKLCGQELITDKLPSMTDLLGQHVDLTQIRKIGEGTFGEAFKAGKVVFKIVPMEGSRLVNGEVQKLSAEILAEVAISLTLSELRGKPGGSGPFGNSNITSGFVETYGVGICRGAYAEALCREWHAWDARNESENDPVDDFPGDQLYVVFVVADGGADLEHFEVRSFKEAKSILLQVALTLAVAEEACQFEHRDLHWGNLLIQRGATGTAHFRLRDTSIEMADAGVAVTLIDFTLSRLNTVTGEVAFLDLSADPELFQGPKGDCQAETYRRMKKATKDHWEAHRPETNTLWMHYLADTMLTLKKFPCSSADKRELRNFRKRALTYGSCGELVWDEFFSGSWLAGAAS